MRAGRTTVALRVAYDGTRFNGSQRQPEVRTVDGDLLLALGRIGADAADFRSASRTDRGVSAVANVVSFSTTFPPEALCGALNAQLKDAWCHGWAPVDADFRPRYAATRRTYRYFLPRERDLDVKRVEAAWSRFLGEHDFSVFSRRDPDREPRRRVDHAVVREEGTHLVFDVAGPSFLWNQVRRMVAAVCAHARGHASLATIERALGTGSGPDLGVAPAEGLVLLDVEMPVAWRDPAGAATRAAQRVGALHQGVRRRAAVLGELERGLARRAGSED